MTQTNTKPQQTSLLIKLYHPQNIGKMILFSLIGFLVFGTLSLMLYPGGNILSRQTSGYHFWHNFLCDALESRVWNGQPNIWGSRFGILAMVFVSLGALLPCWFFVPQLISTHKKQNKLIGGLGILCISGLLLMLGEAFTRMPLSHTVLIMIAGFPGFLATLLFLFLLVQESSIPRHIPIIGTLALIASIANMTLYLRVQYWKVHVTAILPSSQKVAMILLLIWLATIGFDLIKRKEYKD